jgi:hypothetical protein
MDKLRTVISYLIERDKLFSTIPHDLINDEAITNPARLMYLKLSTFARNKGHHLWRGAVKIGKSLNRSERTVRRLIEELREAGWITTIRRGGCNIIVLHAYKGQRISNKEKETYKKMVKEAIDEWEWERLRKKYGDKITGVRNSQPVTE